MSEANPPKKPEPPPPPPPELAPALAAFDAGDFRSADRLAGELLASKPTPEVEAGAKALRARLAVDPWAIRIGIATGAILALVIGAYVL